jgi:hypothetical protein
METVDHSHSRFFERLENLMSNDRCECYNASLPRCSNHCVEFCTVIIDVITKHELPQLLFWTSPVVHLACWSSTDGLASGEEGEPLKEPSFSKSDLLVPRTNSFNALVSHWNICFHRNSDFIEKKGALFMCVLIEFVHTVTCSVVMAFHFSHITCST